ncbi:GNAT family N-acetyltransferase [Flavobacterium foetidum]|uniref:GNAT family N-acetyltransferase n=1 Tax=Flavobacterium foetidum TaxID=2026681 RepID=UPI001FC90DE2|nr:GNAT family N-acetyltransferase [Flavobacterium foetidum]
MKIRITNPDNEKAAPIIEELSENLYIRFGSDGKNSFTNWENNNPDFVFAIAETNNEIVGCGAVRPIDEKTGEIKRMYAKYQGQKIGQSILNFLEEKAKENGFSTLALETRAKNLQAIRFYEKQGYKTIPNYGKYKDRLEAVCFGKSLT